MKKYSCSKPNQVSGSSGIVAREFEGCGVLLSGIITSLITSTPSLRVMSG